MKNLILTLASFGLLTLVSCTAENSEFSHSFNVIIENTIETNRESTLIRLSIQELITKYPDFNSNAYAVYDGSNELSSQLLSSDEPEGFILVVVPSMAMNETKSLAIKYNPEGSIEREYPKLTQAELSKKVGGEWQDREYIGGEFQNVTYLKVPEEHKDHSWYLRYEGPGWESDKVGYRFYLDQRNATDVFGKKVTEPVLHKVGLDGFDSYHEMADWGMDVMKVGSSLGVGSIGVFVDSMTHRVEFTDSVTAEITSNGTIYSSILTNYYGWTTPADTLNVASEISIHAGTRLTQQNLKLSKDSDFICTGVAKDKNGALLTQEPSDSQFGYIASFGPYSLNNDNLGVAVLFDQNSFREFTEDEYSHIVRLNSINSSVNYYFLATWEGEPGGIKTKEGFIEYLQQVTKELANPVVTRIE